jgi:hypothetical protein
MDYFVCFRNLRRGYHECIVENSSAFMSIVGSLIGF